MSEIVLPTFDYHPDPLRTGSVECSRSCCDICRQEKDFRYRWTIYCHEPPDDVCLDCIASGRACQELSTPNYPACITDLSSQYNDFSPEVRDQLEHRTPGFCSWHDERWLTHCGDAAAFLGAVGYHELLEYPDALTDITNQVPDGWAAQHLDQWLQEIDADGEITAYLFGCRHCHRHLAYWDEDNQ